MKIFCPENFIKIGTNFYLDNNSSLLHIANAEIIQLGNLLYLSGSIPVEARYNVFEVVDYEIKFIKTKFYKLKLSNNLETYINYMNKDIDKLKLIPVVNIDRDQKIRTNTMHTKLDNIAKYRSLLNQGLLVYVGQSYISTKPDNYLIENDGVYVKVVSKEVVEFPFIIEFSKDISLIDCLYYLQ